MDGVVTPEGLLTTPALQALLQDGKLAGAWTLDPARSEVRLTTRHTWKLLPLHGVFRHVAGNGIVSTTGVASGVITVDAGSIDTKNPRRDKHLRSGDFFDITSYPDITFAADDVTTVDGAVRITGQLTVRGCTRAASLDAQVSAVDGELWLDGELPVNRADFRLTWNWLGIAAMDNTIAVHAVFTRD
jgi:polyisoprenoid-binding protein YceI